MTALAANICVRNAIDLDYCIQECIESVLPVCDAVYVADGESSDGTRELLDEWASRESKLKVLTYPWPNPVGDIEFWVKWINFCRERIQEPFEIAIDADEVLFEDSYPIIRHFKWITNPDDRVSLMCHRYNFYKDANHLVPEGHCLGHRVIRVAPTSVWMPSDGGHPMGKEISRMVRESDISFGHYGFLRKREAYFEKSRQLHRMFFNSYDQRLVEAEQKLGNWMEQIENVEWTKDLKFFTGSHPRLIVPWLQARNYRVSDDGKPYHE